MNNTDSTDSGWGQYVSIDFDDFYSHSEISILDQDINNETSHKSSKSRYFQRLLSLSFCKTIKYIVLVISLSICIRQVL
jgi:hypothetical protein